MEGNHESSIFDEEYECVLGVEKTFQNVHQSDECASLLCWVKHNFMYLILNMILGFIKAWNILCK
jgi:hypothetical protein